MLRCLTQNYKWKLKSFLPLGKTILTPNARVVRAPAEQLRETQTTRDTGIRIGLKVMKCIIPLKTWFGNSEDPDVMQHYVAFHQGLHSSLKLKRLKESS